VGQNQLQGASYPARIVAVQARQKSGVAPLELGDGFLQG
jgi:hypothetical protein